MTRNVTLIQALLAAALAASVIAAVTICANSLKHTCFITGWFLFVVLTVAFTRRYLKLKNTRKPEAWVAPQTLLAASILFLFAAHIGFKLPTGWLDSILAALFITITFTTLSGAVLATKLRAGTITAAHPLVRRWLSVHFPCVACLLALGFMHATLAHAHGLLAHVMLGK